MVKPGALTGVRKAVIPSAVAGLAAGPGEDQVVRGGMHAGVPGLLAVDHPVAAVAHGGGLHERGVRAVRGLGDPEREAAARPAARPGTHSACCSAVPYSSISSRPTLLPDDHVLVLQVAVQAEALAGQVLADDRPCRGWCRPGRRTRPGTRTGSARRRRPGALASRSSASHSAARQAAAIPVGPGVLAAVVEEPDVVVGCSSGRISRSMNSSSSAR